VTALAPPFHGDGCPDDTVTMPRRSSIPVRPWELRNAQFTTRRLRPSYVMKDVDDLLQEIAEAAARM
jgi:DivIVA domain-containing protein